MKIVILAPTHRSFIAKFLKSTPIEQLPEGYDGAPFIGILIEELLNRGHDVTAITTTSSIGNNNYEEIHFSFDRFKWIVVPARKHTIRFNGKKLGKIFDFFYFERSKMQVLALEEGPDIIHAHWSYEFAAAAKQDKVPFLITIHDNPYAVLRYFRNAYRLGRLLMSKWVLKNVRYISTVSPYMLQHIKDKFPDAALIPNPVVVSQSLDLTRELTNLKAAHLSSPKIIMINNGWDKLKNGEFGLKVYAVIKQQIPGASLHLFGKGTEKEGTAWMAAQTLQLKDVFFNGSVSHQQLMDKIKEAHLLIHPSLEESFGVVLIEAMSNGVPTIGGVKSGAVPWVIKQEKLLVELMDPNKMAFQATEILKNKDMFIETSIECFKNAKDRFSAEIIVDQYEAFYSEIIKSGI